MDASAVAGEVERALEVAGRHLARRARSETEVRGHLADKGFGDAEVEEAVSRLARLGLIDDAAFARAWVEERTAGKGLGVAVLIAELQAKGVARDIAEAAAGHALGDEGERARRVAAARLPKLAGLPLDKQAARLLGYLARRGYDETVARDAVRSVLPPEGWD